MYNVFDMLEKASENTLKYINDAKYKAIINFRHSKKSFSGYIVRLKKNIIKKNTLKDGWFILVSNHIKDIHEAIWKYRKKDVVEKAFNNLKNNNVLKKVGVHSYKNFKAKLLIAFISLILQSKVHDIMSINNLYVNYTIIQSTTTG